MTDRIISSSAVVLKKVKPSVYLGKVGYMADTVSAVMMKSGDSLMQSLCVGFGRGIEIRVFPSGRRLQG